MAEHDHSHDWRPVPILPSRDAAVTEEFWQRLGFRVVNAMPDGDPYLIAVRDGAELHFAHQPDLDPATNRAACYLHVGDATAVHAEWAALGLPAGGSGVARRPDPACRGGCGRPGSPTPTAPWCTSAPRPEPTVSEPGRSPRPGTTATGPPRPAGRERAERTARLQLERAVPLLPAGRREGVEGAALVEVDQADRLSAPTGRRTRPASTAARGTKPLSCSVTLTACRSVTRPATSRTRPGAGAATCSRRGRPCASTDGPRPRPCRAASRRRPRPWTPKPTLRRPEADRADAGRGASPGRTPA